MNKHIKTPIINTYFNPGRTEPDHFSISDSTQKLTARLESLGLHCESSQTFVLTLYDSFDWRLHKAGLWLLQWQSEAHAGTVLTSFKEPWLIQEQGILSGQGNASELHRKIQPLLNPRTALAKAELQASLRSFSLLDAERKTLARCYLTRYQHQTSGAQTQLTIQPLRGYLAASKALIEQCKAQFDLTRLADRIEALYDLAGVQPSDYSAKPTFALDPAEPASEACRRALLWLLDTMRRNEAGLKQNLDSEFLHDYRVAVRRSRSLLARCAKSCPALADYGKSLKWLGQLTGPTRDLDVYLLAMPKFRAQVPVPLQAALDPLKALLERQQRQAHRRLVRVLESKRYRQFMQDWEAFLTDPPSPAHNEAAPMPSIGIVAGKGLGRVYKKVRQEGRAITPQSPPEDLHRLRKTCKKLRYLIDTLPGVYAVDKIAALMPVLKNLQSLLGDYQDCSVQIEHLSRFAAVLHEDAAVPVETLLALGALITELDRRQHELRAHFAEQFTKFDSKTNRRLFRDLTEACRSQ